NFHLTGTYTVFSTCAKEILFNFCLQVSCCFHSERHQGELTSPKKRAGRRCPTGSYLDLVFDASGPLPASPAGCCGGQQRGGFHAHAPAYSPSGTARHSPA